MSGPVRRTQPRSRPLRKSAEEIGLEHGDHEALEAGCDEAGQDALKELGLSPERIREVQGLKPGQTDPRKHYRPK